MQSCRQTNRQTDIQADSQPDRQTDIHTYVLMSRTQSIKEDKPIFEKFLGATDHKRSSEMFWNSVCFLSSSNPPYFWAMFRATFSVFWRMATAPFWQFSRPQHPRKIDLSYGDQKSPQFFSLCVEVKPRSNPDSETTVQRKLFFRLKFS